MPVVRGQDVRNRGSQEDHQLYVEHHQLYVEQHRLPPKLCMHLCPKVVSEAEAVHLSPPPVNALLSFLGLVLPMCAEETRVPCLRSMASSSHASTHYFIDEVMVVCSVDLL